MIEINRRSYILLDIAKEDSSDYSQETGMATKPKEKGVYTWAFFITSSYAPLAAAL
jgi:hypothetical protein